MQVTRNMAGARITVSNPCSSFSTINTGSGHQQKTVNKQNKPYVPTVNYILHARSKLFDYLIHVAKSTYCVCIGARRNIVTKDRNGDLMIEVQGQSVVMASEAEK